jgi:hypothetical protein
MERVEGLLQNLRLSEEESQGVKIDWMQRRKSVEGSHQAIGKLLSERPAHPDAICQSLGFVWCPMPGIDCREVGDNLFLFTFKQESGNMGSSVWSAFGHDGPRYGDACGEEAGHV